MLLWAPGLAGTLKLKSSPLFLCFGLLSGLLRLLFNNFQRPLAKSDFVHGRLRIAMGHICNNDARS